MTANVPWSVNAVEPDTWATAREAARRSGMSVGEWLEAAIQGSAVEHGIARRGAESHSGQQFQHQLSEISERLDYLMQGKSPKGRSAPPAESAEQNRLLHSVDALTDRIDALIGDIRSNDDQTPHQIKGAIDRLDSRLESLFTRTSSAPPSREPEIERKLSDIARGIEMMSRRVEMENAQYAPAHRAPSISDLDAAIADITVRQVALDDGTYTPETLIAGSLRSIRVSDLRLAPMSNSSDLNTRSRILPMKCKHCDVSRFNPIPSSRCVATWASSLAPSPNSRPGVRLTRWSAQLQISPGGLIVLPSRKNMRMSAKSLSSLQQIRTALAEVKPAESFSAVERDLRTLFTKLDGLNERGVDNDTIARLQSQTSEIRDLLSNALPTDVLKALVGQIETMVQRFEHSPSPNEGAVMDVVASLERRIDTFAERVEAATRQPAPSPALDEIKNRLEQIESALDRGDTGTPGGLETTMKNLVGKLDAAEERLSSLGSLERGLSDLFGQMNEVRTSAMEVAERAMRSQPPITQAPALAPEIHNHHAPAEASPKIPSPVREQMFSAPQERTPRIEPVPMHIAPVLRAEPRSIALDPETATVTSAQTEGDYPLEPGSGSPRVRPGQSASERVALSEAALGGLTPSGFEASSSTSNYIAAARRAAQAAAAQQTETSSTKIATKQAAAFALFSGNKRALMLGFLLVAVTFGAVRFSGIGNMISFLQSSTPAPTVEKQVPTITRDPKPSEPVKTDPEKHSALPTKNDLSIEGAPLSEMVAPNMTPNMLNKPDVESDPTGSVKSLKAATPTPSFKVETASIIAGDLPAAIGTTALRNAALAGDPVAAYEVGSRYFDGQGVQTNTIEAKRWFEIAHAKGSIAAA